MVTEVVISARAYSRRHWMLTARAGRYGRGPLLTALVVPSGSALVLHEPAVRDWLCHVQTLYGPCAVDRSFVDWSRETGIQVDLECEV